VLRAAQNLDRSLAGSLLDPGPAVYVRSLGPSKWLFLSRCKSDPAFRSISSLRSLRFLVT